MPSNASDARRSEPRHRLTRRARRRAGSEGGQAIILTVIALAVLLGMVGLTIDLGYAYYSHRALQGAADAAALAGAAQLPDSTASVNVASQYGTATTGKNALNNVSNITETILPKCVSTMPGCFPNNAITVTETANAKTFFLRALGINSIPITVRSTACGPCAGRPADIMLIFDRTGSMCMDFNGNNDPSCSKLKNARNGMETLLSTLDPTEDRVGLAVLPPSTSAGAACSKPPSNVYDSTSSVWVLQGLTSTYQTSPGNLDHSSTIVHDIDCLQASGSTAYADAIDKAQAELNAHGRSDAQHYIVFFTDGAANTGPAYYPKTSPYRVTPCHQGVTSANNAKSQHTIVYAIGYTLNGMGGWSNRCQSMSSSGPDESPSITAYQALSQIATSSDTFYNQPDPGSLNAIFAQVAAKITGPRLISDDTP